MFLFRVILFLTSLIFIFLSLYSFYYRRSKGASVFSLLMLSAFFYAFGYTFELGSNTLGGIRFWLYVQYIGIPFIPTLWLIFSIQFTGNEKWLNSMTLVLLMLISFSTLLINFTNDLHHLFYKSIGIEFAGSYALSRLTKGPWYWVHIAYSNFTILCGVLLFLNMYLKCSLLYKRQAFIMLLGSLGPWAGHLIYMFNIGPENIDTSPIIMSISGIIYTWGMFHYRLLDLIPIAAERVFNSINEGILILDRSGRMINYNPAASQLGPVIGPSFLGKNILHDFGDLSGLLLPVVQDRDEQIFIEWKSGKSVRNYHVKCSPVISKRQKIHGWVIIFNDITNIVEKEKVLKKNEIELKELNATKDKFFRIISHDLKNPFAQLQGLTDILKAEISQKNYDGLPPLMDLIGVTLKSGSKLLEDLLIWANTQTGRISCKQEYLRFKEVVDQLLFNMQNFIELKNIFLRTDFDENLLIYADKNMLDLVLRNLATNAIKFSKPGGEVIIKARVDEKSVIVSVKDYGVGITKKNIEKLFRIDQIYTTPGTKNEKGTGLGLILCKDFIHMHKGKIWIESEPGSGSEFFVSFPDKS